MKPSTIASILSAAVLLLASGCGANATDPAASPAAGPESAPVRPRPAPDKPVSRTSYLDFFRVQVTAACSTSRGQEMSKLSEHDCLAYIENVTTICEAEALAAMPEVVFEEHEAAARA